MGSFPEITTHKGITLLQRASGCLHYVPGRPKSAPGDSFVWPSPGDTLLALQAPGTSPHSRSSRSLVTGEGNGSPLQPSCLENPMEGGAWWAAVHAVAKSRTQLSDFTFTFHFHALEKEVATHSSVLAWRIPGTGSLVGCSLWVCTESDTAEATCSSSSSSSLINHYP